MQQVFVVEISLTGFQSMGFAYDLANRKSKMVVLTLITATDACSLKHESCHVCYDRIWLSMVTVAAIRFFLMLPSV